MAKTPPGESGKKGVARRDDGPTHQMSIHPEFGEDDAEDLTDQSEVPPELVKKIGVAPDGAVPPARLSGPSGDKKAPETQLAPKGAPSGGDMTAPETKLPPKAASPPLDRTAPETKLSALYGDPPSSDKRLEPSPPPRPESKEHKAVPRDSKESRGSKGPSEKPGFSSDTRVEPAPPARPEPKESKEPQEKPGFSSDTRVEPAPPARPEPKESKEPKEKPGFSSDTRVEPAPPSRESGGHKAASREPKDAKEPRASPGPKKEPPEAPKGYFERTDPNARPHAPSPPPEENVLPWESSESEFGATTPLPDLRDQLPPEKAAQQPPPAAGPSVVPTEDWPDEPVLKEPPRRSATRDGLRRMSSQSVPAADAPPKKAPKPTRDAVPVSVANQETNVRAAPTSRDVAGQETRIKAAPSEDERSGGRSNLANQNTNIKAAPEAAQRRRTGVQPAVRGDFPEGEPRRAGSVANASTVLKPIPDDVQAELGVGKPRKAANVANSSTVLKPIPEDVQEELAVEKPARRSGSRDAARKPAPIERADPTPPPQEIEEPEGEPEPPPKPKPLPFVDKRPRLASSADVFEATAKDPDRQPKARGAKRMDPRASKVFQTLSHLKTMSAGNQKALAVAAGVFFFIVAAVVVVGILRGGDRPREDELRRAYPFGYAGARGPRGEQAPGAGEVAFTFKMRAPCPQTAEPDCLLYEYSKGAFQGRMLLRKTDQGWVRASDEGAPFLIVK